MAEGARDRPLRWKSYRLAVSDRTALRHLAFDAKAVFAKAALPGLAPPSLAMEIPLPDPDDLPPAPVDRCHVLLQKAAEIEHALMAQYLYAAFSLDHDAARDIAGVAVEEMGHLMTVQNLLTLIRRPPHLHRQDFGIGTPVEERVFPFDLLLEPLSKTSLAKYVTAEAPHEIGSEEPLLDKIRALAMSATGETVNRVGVLYALLGVIVGTDALLLEQAQQEGPHRPWYQIVSELSTKTLQGGKTVGELFGHLADEDFDPDSAQRQATAAVWNRSREDSEASEHFRIFTATSRLQALEALADIGLQGEGPSSNESEDTHFERFFDLFKRQFGADGEGEDPFPVAAVPAAPVIAVGTDDANGITHPDTVLAARLGNVRYALLVGFLEQYFVAPLDARDFLVGWCFAEMFYLRHLALLLVTLHRRPEGGDLVAALPLTMPPADQLGLPAGANWSAVHAARLNEAITLATEMQQLDAFAEQRQLLTYMLETDGRKLREATARQAGGTVQTPFDRVRSILDAGAGAGEPRHNRPQLGPQRRFWNQPRDAFVQLRIGGGGAIVTLGDGAQSRLVRVLRHEIEPHMPAHRSPLSPASIDAIEQWIDDGCPDE